MVQKEWNYCRIGFNNFPELHSREDSNTVEIASFNILTNNLIGFKLLFA